MTSPRGVRRNIYPHDASDPSLRWCKDCDYPYMPAGGCKVHEGRCLTCCSVDQPLCVLNVTPAQRKEWRVSEVVEDLTEEAARAKIQADIDSLYGPPGGQR